MCCELLFRPLLRLENAQMKVVKKKASTRLRFVADGLRVITVTRVNHLVAQSARNLAASGPPDLSTESALGWPAQLVSLVPVQSTSTRPPAVQHCPCSRRLSAHTAAVLHHAR